MFKGVVKYVICIALLFCFTAVQAADMVAIKKSMEARLERVDSLKESGAVGENNLGYLQAIGDEKKIAEATAKLVDEENADRKNVYEAIAKKNKITVEATGKLRAKQIAERAEPGEWLQKEDGDWYQKKAAEKGK